MFSPVLKQNYVSPRHESIDSTSKKSGVSMSFALNGKTMDLGTPKHLQRVNFQSERVKSANVSANSARTKSSDLNFGIEGYYIAKPAHADSVQVGKFSRDEKKRDYLTQHINREAFKIPPGHYKAVDEFHKVFGKEAKYINFAYPKAEKKSIFDDVKKLAATTPGPGKFEPRPVSKRILGTAK